MVLAGGAKGRAFLPYRVAQCAADLLDTAVVEFPGHHAGYYQYPEEFAQQLHQILAA